MVWSGSLWLDWPKQAAAPGQQACLPMEMWLRVSEIDPETGNEREIGYAVEKVLVPFEE